MCGRTFNHCNDDKNISDVSETILTVCLILTTFYYLKDDQSRRPMSLSAQVGYAEESSFTPPYIATETTTGQNKENSRHLTNVGIWKIVVKIFSFM